MRKSYICGILSGSTKRTAWFRVSRENQAIAQAGATISPGVFFVSSIQWISPLTPGDYEVKAGYERPVVISSKFEVREGGCTLR